MNEELIDKFYEESKVQHVAEQGGNITYFDYRKFAELIVVDCLIEIEHLGTRSGPTEHNKALNAAWKAISEKFGVTET